jgi:hypothetical protein
MRCLDYDIFKMSNISRDSYESLTYREYRNILQHTALYFMRLYTANNNKNRITFRYLNPKLNKKYVVKNIFNYRHVLKNVVYNENLDLYIFNLISISSIDNHLVEINFKTHRENKFFKESFKKIVVKEFFKDAIEFFIKEYILKSKIMKVVVSGFCDKRTANCKIVFDEEQQHKKITGLCEFLNLKVDVVNISKYQEGDILYIYREASNLKKAQVIRSGLINSKVLNKKFYIENNIELVTSEIAKKYRKSIISYIQYYYFMNNGWFVDNKTSNTSFKHKKFYIKFSKELGFFYLETSSQRLFNFVATELYKMFGIKLKTKSYIDKKISEIKQ